MAGAVARSGKKEFMGFWMLNYCTFQFHFAVPGLIPPTNRNKDAMLHPKTKFREQPLGLRVLVGESEGGNFDVLLSQNQAQET